jgi:hypothetical protein
MSLEAFPALDGITRTEVVLFRSQRNDYDYAARMTGAQIVAADSVRAALSPRTACVLWFAGAHYAEDAPPIQEVVPPNHAIGRGMKVGKEELALNPRTPERHRAQRPAGPP